MINIRAREDRPVEHRAVTGVLGQIWKITRDLLDSKQSWKDGMAMGTTGVRGDSFYPYDHRCVGPLLGKAR